MSKGASANGRSPPTLNTPVQPYSGSSRAATTPALAAPIVMPHNTTANMTERRLTGLISVTSAMALGRAAPRPNPVTMRRNSNDSSE